MPASQRSSPLEGAEAEGPTPPVKRTRVLLSCTTCRNSKLKCDRAHPCGQCLKKGKPEGCVFTPKREKERPPKSMAARLKRLEGMVRGMIDVDGPAKAPKVSVDEPTAGGQVVHGDRATSYVGGTHFMAALEDIDELKNYFEYPEDDDEEIQDPYDTAGSPEHLLFSKNVARNKEDLLAMLPEKSVIDRLMIRYFNSNSPSQHILHKPTFAKEYNEFWKDQSKVSLHWIAQLFMVMALGVFFSSFAAPHELQSDSPAPAMDTFKRYRGAAGWALIWGKYSQPGPHTLQGFLLYVEGEFLANRQSMMNCYLLSSVLIRIMLKMGLHRDPSKLPNITPYDGEMRRRTWNLAIQIDLLVSFHLGMPSMIHGIESDTSLPRNLIDTDFSKDSKELPLPRPASDYTALTYPINKAAVCRCFGLVARQAHSLKVPTYAEVMKVDQMLEETYRQVPVFMKVKPLEEAITDPPMQVSQRFGLAALYQKSRCVLHRRYLTEATPRKEHAYSRKVCLEAALALLEYQYTVYEATKPGAILAQNGWFLTALATNDFLLADMIIAMIIENEHYSEVGGNYDWMTQGTPAPTKDELLQRLRRSLMVWREVALAMPDGKRAADVVETILKRAETRRAGVRGTVGSTESQVLPSDETDSMPGLTVDGYGSSGPSAATISPDEGFLGFGADANQAPLAQLNGLDIDPSFLGVPEGFDWGQFDAITRGTDDAPTFQTPSQQWLDVNPLDDSDYHIVNSWNAG